MLSAMLAICTIGDSATFRNSSRIVHAGILSGVVIMAFMIRPPAPNLQRDPPSPRLRQDRLSAVDALRGGVMIVMALDHVRDFIHRGAMSQSPTDLATTTTALFLTRWVTHVCAPVFMLTAGLGAYFYLRNGERTKGQLARFLVTRGLWLMFLEL